MRRAALLVVLAALAAPVAAQAGASYTPNDPFVPRQWYLERDRALDVFNVLKQLMTVRVAVIDSGVDLGHPELKGRVVAWRSFVGGTVADAEGHGTFVAGEIAALTGNGQGIAGLAPPARLLVAKVVREDGTISPRAEARAIRWAVRLGARVINLSFGSVRDPGDFTVDGFSRAEQRAVEFAVRRGVLVVAPVGNADAAPTKPWHYASYPAAFPHVLGVAAYGRSGGVPLWSNRDAVHVDLAAPGVDMFSLFPRVLTTRKECSEQGYSSCGPREYRDADGTSFSAPQASAAAAILLSEAPMLRPDQVATILKGTADDATPANGCADCTVGHDELTGFGRLDVAAALQALRGPLPPADRLEPNDDVNRAATVYDRLRTRATLDAWEDQNDVYRVHLKRRQRVTVVVRSNKIDASIVLWKPALYSLADADDSLRARRSIHPFGARERIAFRARKSGWYYLQVKLARPGSGRYSIRLVTS